MFPIYFSVCFNGPDPPQVAQPSWNAPPAAATHQKCVGNTKAEDCACPPACNSQSSRLWTLFPPHLKLKMTHFQDNNGNNGNTLKQWTYHDHFQTAIRSSVGGPPPPPFKEIEGHAAFQYIAAPAQSFQRLFENLVVFGPQMSPSKQGTAYLHLNHPGPKALCKST